MGGQRDRPGFVQVDARVGRLAMRSSAGRAEAMDRSIQGVGQRLGPALSYS